MIACPPVPVHHHRMHRVAAKWAGSYTGGDGNTEGCAIALHRCMHARHEHQYSSRGAASTAAVTPGVKPGFMRLPAP